jgi:hypothetical protein
MSCQVMKATYTLGLIVASFFILGLLIFSVLKDYLTNGNWVRVLVPLAIALLAIWALMKRNNSPKD